MAAPFENLHHLLPVGNILVLEMLHGGTGYYHAVELLVLHQFEVAVERLHVLYGSVLGRVRLHLHQMYLHLQGCVGQEAEQVRLGGYLQGHQVQYGNTQGAYVLMLGSLIAEYKDVLFLQVLYGGQFIR